MERLVRRQLARGAPQRHHIANRKRAHLPPLQLFAADDDFKNPIMRFIKPQKDYTTKPPTLTTPAQLVFTSRAEELRDTVVMSFLFLEKTRRTRQNSSQNMADVMGTPALSI